MADPWYIRERRQMANLRSKQNKIKKALAERKAAEKESESKCEGSPDSNNENDAEEYPGLWAMANHLAAKMHRKRFNAEKNEIARLGRKMLQIKKARAKRGAPEIVGREEKLKKALAKKKLSENVGKPRGRKISKDIKVTKRSKPAGRPPGSKNKSKDTN